MRPRLSLLVFLTAVLLWATATLGQSPPIDASAVVRVRAGTSAGSGVYLGDRLVLTAAHVFRDEPTNAAVYFPDGKGFSGRLAANDTRWDQAVVELNREPEHPGVPLASDNPARGDVVYAAGYGSGNTVQLISGRVGNYLTSQVGQPADWFELRGGAAQPGSSGGPIVNARGEVIGCLWGSRQQEQLTVAVVAGRTQRFLLPWNARLAAVRATLAQCGPSTYAPPRAPLVDSGRQVQIAPSRPSPIPSPSTTAPPSLQPSVDYDRIADLVLERMRADPGPFTGQAGPPGPPGERGPAGPTGEKGQPGEPAAIDTLALAAAIQSALPGITIRTVDGSGRVIDSEDIPLGGTLNIHHAPLRNK